MNKSFYLLLLGVMLSTSSYAQTAYTWEDANGVLHFSDTPPDGRVKNKKTLDLPDPEENAPQPEYESAKNIPLNPTQDPNAEPDNSNDSATTLPEAVEKKEVALTVAIDNLQHDQTIRSSRGLITIVADTNRKLDIGEQFQLMFDGSAYGAPQTNKIWELKNIDRGTHTLQISALKSGKVIASSIPITVHLHRSSVK